MQIGSSIPGKIFGGRYALERLLGRGGIGEVVLARDMQLDRWVAIKRFYATSEEVVRRTESAMTEARNLAALQHPNIVTIYDFLQEDGEILVVMEYVQGRTLDDIVTAAPLMFDDFVEIALQCLDGMAAAHSLGMLHRDIKPANIMVSTTASGRLQVKILDFGLSKISEEPVPQTVDHTGTLLGSIFTMAPEQFEQAPLDVRTDLYSLGCVLYQALCGRMPYEGRSIASVMAGHLNGAFESLAPQRPDVPQAACAWTERLLSRNPEERPHSATEAAGLLRAIVGTTRGVPLQQHQTMQQQQPQVVMRTPVQAVVDSTPIKSNKWILPTAIVGGLVVLLILGFFFLGQKEKTPSAKSSKAVAAKATTPRKAKTGAHKVAETKPVAKKSAQKKEAGGLKVLDMSDKVALLNAVGQKVHVEGVADRVGENKSGTIRFLNFRGAIKGDFTLVFHKQEGDKDISKSDIERYLGRGIRVEGVITEFKGTPQIEVRDLSQIQVLP